MDRTSRIEASLNNVEKLLDEVARKKTSASTKKQASKKAPAKKAATAKKAVPGKRGAPAKKAVKAGTKVAAAHIYLPKLQRLISRGAMSSEEFVGAVVEALRAKRVNTSLAGAIAQVLREALGTGETMDMLA